VVHPASPIRVGRLLLGLVLLTPCLGAASPADVRNEGPKEPAQLDRQVTVPEDIADLRAIEAQVKAVAAKVVPCTVAVRVGTAQGSGVIVTEDGYVLTAGHVADEPGQNALFIFSDGKKAKGTTLGIHRHADAGLAKIDGEGPWPHLEMGDSGELPLGAWCVAAGHPLGYREGRPPVIRLGRVLESRADAIRTDCPLVAGDSGGPLVDLEGKVIGVNSRIGGSVKVNVHVPATVFRDHWERLAKGEDWDDGTPGKDSSEVRAAFGQVIAEAGACVVRVKCDGKDAALGTIVGPDGWVVTKASELRGPIVCRSRDGQEWVAQIAGVHPQYDLAMLKVEAAGLPPIPWADDPDPAVGAWVAAPGPDDGTPLAVGAIGGPRRKIPPMGGVLGIGVGDADQGARVVKVLPDSPAAAAGLQIDDVITHVEGDPALGLHELIAAIRRHPPGRTVRLTVQRGDETLEVSARLARIDTPGARKREVQNRSQVGISRRHDDFPVVLQHDTVLRPVDCGGPLVDLSGRVLGVNIARGGRTETYCVPSDVLLTLMYDLMSGRLRPTEAKPEQNPGDVEAPPPDEDGKGPGRHEEAKGPDESESGGKQHKLVAGADVVYAIG